MMGLYLLNISVDTTDPNPEYIPEDLSINDQESIIEIIVEKVLGYGDVIKEYDDYDTEDKGKKNLKIDLLDHVAKMSNCTNNQLIISKKYHPGYVARLTNGFIEIDSPPPNF